MKGKEEKMTYYYVLQIDKSWEAFAIDDVCNSHWRVC